MAYAGASPATPAATAPAGKLALSTIAGGDRGAEQTLEAMRGQVHAGLRDPVVLTTAGNIVRPAAARDYPAHFRLLRAWLFRHTKFLRDPRGVELLRAPRYMLDEAARLGIAQGDCDDVAVLAATLAAAIGIPARLCAVGFSGPTGPLSHVYAEIRIGSQWVALDTTRPASVTIQPTRRFPPLEV